MNLFSSSEFLEVMGEVFHPTRSRSIELRGIEGRVLRLLVVDGTIVRSAPFYDFPQPLEPAPSGPIAALAYFPRTVQRTIAAQPFSEAGTGPGTQPSPYLDWSTYTGTEAFTHALEANANLADSRRQQRRLEKTLGPVRFTFDDPSESAFAACLAWKSAQYLASGYDDLFAHAPNVELFRRLRERKLVVVNSLVAGTQLLATHLAGVHDRRFAWWVPAYDPAFSKFSPGRLLLEAAMLESQARGDLEFDFLIGNERYKYLYATHTRIIGPLGLAPRIERWSLQARTFAKHALHQQPRLERFVKQLRSRPPQ